MNARTLLSAGTLLLLLAFSRDARAEAPRFDVEVDPTAYALGGYSLHVGVDWKRLRLDLGAFAMDVPEAIHGNEGFDASFDGYGAKLELFPFAESGAFVGVGAGINRSLVQLQGSDLASRDSRLSVGVHVGWRLDVVAGFYVKPWLGLDYTFDGSDVQLGDRNFENQHLQLFPAIHLGYRI